MKTYLQEIFDATPGGVSSALDPDMIPAGFQAWGVNTSFRGGRASTRFGLIQRAVLPAGYVQAAEVFSIQDGMIIASIGGQIHRVKISGNSFSVSEIDSTIRNSTILREAWIIETPTHLVIQDGQSDALIYDGVMLRRADRSILEVPRGRAMAYGNGRLWVAVNDREVVAGDIKTSEYGTDLKFTENTYLNGGGAFYFQSKITGMEFLPSAGGSGQGALIVFGAFNTDGIRADITSRDLWSQMPSFIGTVVGGVGAVNQNAIVQVNKDLYWRDSEGGIRSLNGAISDAQSAGTVPISREVSRITDFESPSLLRYSSGILFDNRLLMTASPYYNKNGSVSFRDVISLDFAPLSQHGQKLPPAYDGIWQGIGFSKLLMGTIGGVKRAFAVSSDSDGTNRLWEFVRTETEDKSLSIPSTPITAMIETPRRSFNSRGKLKKLYRCDVYLAKVEGPITLDIYFRMDNREKWTRWEPTPFRANAKLTAPDNSAFSDQTLSPQGRTQIRSFSIPESTNAIDNRFDAVGFEVQLRIVWSGHLKIHSIILHADGDIAQPIQANRAEFSENPAYEVVTGNEITYTVPLS